jgi:hypothetical protein
MQIASFDATLKLLERLDPWLISLEIQPKNDRWHEALKIVARAREQRQSIEQGGQREFIDNYISGLFDATSSVNDPSMRTAYGRTSRRRRIRLPRNWIRRETRRTSASWLFL